MTFPFNAEATWRRWELSPSQHSSISSVATSASTQGDKIANERERKTSKSIVWNQMKWNLKNFFVSIAFRVSKWHSVPIKFILCSFRLIKNANHLTFKWKMPFTFKNVFSWSYKWSEMCFYLCQFVVYWSRSLNKSCFSFADAIWIYLNYPLKSTNWKTRHAHTQDIATRSILHSARSNIPQ